MRGEGDKPGKRGKPRRGAKNSYQVTFNYAGLPSESNIVAGDSLTGAVRSGIKQMQTPQIPSSVEVRRL